jgi:hypothetical protein
MAPPGSGAGVSPDAQVANEKLELWRYNSCCLGGHPQEGSKMGHLGWRLHSLGLNEDDPAVVTIATTAVDGHDGTCRILGR